MSERINCYKESARLKAFEGRRMDECREYADSFFKDCLDFYIDIMKPNELCEATRFDILALLSYHAGAEVLRLTHQLKDVEAMIEKINPEGYCLKEYFNRRIKWLDLNEENKDE